VLLSANVKFTNTFQKNTILTHIIISLILCNRCKIDQAGIVSREIDSRYLLHALL